MVTYTHTATHTHTHARTFAHSTEAKGEAPDKKGLVREARGGSAKLDGRGEEALGPSSSVRNELFSEFTRTRTVTTSIGAGCSQRPYRIELSRAETLTVPVPVLACWSHCRSCAPFCSLSQAPLLHRNCPIVFFPAQPLRRRAGPGPVDQVFLLERN